MPEQNVLVHLISDGAIGLAYIGFCLGLEPYLLDLELGPPSVSTDIMYSNLMFSYRPMYLLNWKLNNHFVRFKLFKFPNAQFEYEFVFINLPTYCLHLYQMFHSFGCFY